MSRAARGALIEEVGDLCPNATPIFWKKQVSMAILLILADIADQVETINKLLRKLEGQK